VGFTPKPWKPGQVISFCEELSRSEGKNQKGGFTMKLIKFLVLLVLAFQLTGCVFTKVVTVPMRMGGAIISSVPVIGNPADQVVDAGADVIDLIPF